METRDAPAMTPAELREHLLSSPSIIERHRSLLEPAGKPLGDDSPGGVNGFSSKLPFNLLAMEMSDQEALVIGSLARYCIELGAIPRMRLNAFWWVNGHCMGLRTGSMAALRQACRTMSNHAEEIVNAEGVGEYLEELIRVRARSLKIFPQENDDWVGVKEAADIAGTSEDTVRKWIEANAIRVYDPGEEYKLVSREDVKIRCALIYASRLQSLRRAREARTKEECEESPDATVASTNSIQKQRPSGTAPTNAET